MTGLADRSWLHVAAGFFVMGGWAAFANRAHPMPAPIVAGLVQGTLSATITFGLKTLLEKLVGRMAGYGGLIIPPVAACAMSVMILSTLHSLAGTPEVWATVAVPTSVVTLYAAVYTWRLRSRDG